MRHERMDASDAEAQLARALVASAGAAGLAVTVAHHRSRPWASATFVGAQHRLALVGAPGAALARWAAGLPDAELALRGHVVASLAIEPAESGTATLAIAALTLQDD